MNTDRQTLDRALTAWNSLAAFRARRRRAIDFSFGRQWGDMVRLPSGRTVSEERQLLESGRVPITNNLIRQLVKSIVGRWRYLRATPGGEEGEATPAASAPVSPLEETDARTLEEFLISGCAAQRVGGDGVQAPGAVAVSPARLFFSRFERPDASDCRFLGMLHDMAPARVATLFGRGDPRRTAAIAEAYSPARGRPADSGAAPLAQGEAGFDWPSTPGAWRVIEVWSLDALPMLGCHDPERGEYVEAPLLPAAEEALEALNARRRREGRREVGWRATVAERWSVTWLTPTGLVLARRRCPAGARPPLTLGLYPMVDGEARGLVEDLIGQQKYVNRLIMMLDDVMRSAAKGVVLFPVDQLPEGMTWRDVRRLWSEPGAVLPFRRTSRNIMPYQMQTSGTQQGAAEMLRVQLAMFDEISGSSSGTRGTASTTAAGAEMLRREFEQATVSIYDLLASFRAFTSRRDNLLNTNAKTKL